MKNKIIPNKDLKKKIKFLKKNKKKIVLCHGVFDLFHIGHLRHFKFAKKNSDILFVSLTSDRFVRKGYGKPVFNESLRAELVSSISEVDYVFISDKESAVDSIKVVQPDYYCKGKEYKKNDITKKIKLEIREVKKYNGKIIYSDDLTHSSSELINQNFKIFSKEQEKLINHIKKNYTFKDIVKEIEKISKLNVIILGEIIIDEYVFSEAVGKSAKEPILILQENKIEKYIGGAGAIAKNANNFCKNTSLISYVGDKNNTRFINQLVGKDIKKFFIKKYMSPTIIKRRYVDQSNNSKLFGVYNFNNDDLANINEKEIIKVYKSEIKKNDLVIITDYGHGLISSNFAKLICKSKKFFSINVQLNASNSSYHSLNKYKKSNLLVMNERELRNEFRDKNSDIKNLIQRTSRFKNFKLILVTRGSEGLLLYDIKNKKYYECPAFAENIIDKIGSGDIVHTIFSLCIKAKINYILSLFISSIAAAEKIKSFANKNLIDKNILLKIISHYLK